MLERDAELAVLEATLDGGGSAVAVVGEAGIGKTTLLNHVAERARQAGLTVRTARGWEQEREHPFGLAVQLLGPFEEPGDHLQILHRLFWRVADLADQAPVLLVVDDVHWADAASLAWLLFLVRRLEGLPVTIFAGARTGEPEAGQGPLLAEMRALRPRALSATACAELCEQALGNADAARDCHDATGGNPFLLSELLREMAARPAAPAAELTPARVADAAVVRLARLGPESESIARAASVLGSESTLARAGDLAGLAPDLRAETADRLIEAGIIGALRPFDFAHPLLRAAIRESLSPAHRADLHHRAARLLHESGAPAEEVGAHLLHSEPAGHDWVVTAARAAAGVAMRRGSPASAVPLLERALAEPPPPELRPAVVLELGTAGARCGQADALVHLEAALEHGDDDVRSVALEQLVQVLGFMHRADEAAAIVDRELNRASTDAARQRIEVTRALLQANVVGDVGWERDDIPPAVAAALAYSALWRARPVHEISRLAARALDDTQVFARTDALPAWFTLAALVVAEDQPAAESAFASAISRSTESGSPGGAGVALGLRAWMRLRQGRLLQAEEDIRASAEYLLDYAGPREFSVGVLVRVLVLMGRLDDARAELGDADFAPSPIGIYFLEGRAALRAAEGAADAALDDLFRIGGWVSERGAVAPGIDWRSAAVPLLLARGEADRALELADELLAIARVHGAPRLMGAASHARGLVLDDAAALGAAVEHLDARLMPLDRAGALVSLGSALRRSGRRVEAREPLREALDLAHRCNAEPLARRALEEARMAGARPRRLAATGIESLSTAERRAVRLAARGRTNREIAQALFLTPKTVEKQLSSAYAKLGVAGRDELPQLD